MSNIQQGISNVQQGMSNIQQGMSNVQGRRRFGFMLNL